MPSRSILDFNVVGGSSRIVAALLGPDTFPLHNLSTLRMYSFSNSFQDFIAVLPVEILACLWLSSAIALMAFPGDKSTARSIICSSSRRFTGQSYCCRVVNTMVLIDFNGLLLFSQWRCTKKEARAAMSSLRSLNGGIARKNHRCAVFPYPVSPQQFYL